jgi:hypothetical protein
MLKVGPCFYHFSYFHILSPWPTPGLPGTHSDEMTKENSTESVNNFPFEYWRYHALEKT